MTIEKEVVQRHLDAAWKDWKIAGILRKEPFETVYEIYKDDLKAGTLGEKMTSVLEVFYIESSELEELCDNRTLIMDVNIQNRQGSLNRQSAADLQNRQGSLNRQSAADLQNRQGSLKRQSAVDLQNRQGSLNRQSAVDLQNRQGFPADSEPAADYRLLSDNIYKQPGPDRQEENEKQPHDSSTGIMDVFLEKASSEIRTMMNLKGNPHLVNVEDYHISRDEGFCIIMIRMEKLNCLPHLIRNGMLTPGRENVIRLGIDICKALESCEDINVIHGDLKPDNLYFREKSGFELGGFGVSRIIESVLPVTFGAKHYMSPELYYGRDYDNRADIYSLGIVLYQLMNDYFPPFYTDNAKMTGAGSYEEACMRRMRGEQLPAPANADPLLASIICRACSFYPQDRYSTAGELRKALEKCLTESNPAAEPGEKDRKDLPTEKIDIKNNTKNKTQSNTQLAVKIAIGILSALLFIVVGVIIGKRMGHGSPDEPVYVSAGTDSSSTTGSAEEAGTGKPAGSAVTAGTGETSEFIEEAGTGETDESGVEAGTGKTDEPGVEAGTGKTSGTSVTEAASKLDEEVAFKDPALEKAIRTSLNLRDNQPITRRIALRTEKIEYDGDEKASSEKISDLTGLSAFANLTELDLPSNKISDISELSSLNKLEKLMLEGNSIKDLTPLQDLKELRSLEMAYNKIDSLEPIYGLAQVELLDVIGNQITTIEGIGTMININTLRIGKNRITDISPVGELSYLNHFSFGFNEVEDISVLYAFPNMEVLTLNSNQVRDISPVLNMNELYWLEVAGNPIEDQTVFDRLPESVVHLEK